ncbi:lipid-A-disaccharide synthase [Alteromonadaceae bacterium M269]|nr:lipid-A-disaccharide synthase [Alteromonadaceae bacterium M269]
MSDQCLRVGIVAGEASGDILGAGLIKSIKEKYPNAQIEGIGGAQMIAQGCHSHFDLEELSVMGLVEVLSRIRRLLAIRKHLVQYFTKNPPDVFIGIDAPDFNLGLELRLKKVGIKTVHYVSPSVWAWREKRIFKIEKATNLVLSLLPFEKEFYDEKGVPCTFVGHTLADQVPVEPDKESARNLLGVQGDNPVLALLPGSRSGEVNMLLERFIATAFILNERFDDLQILIPVVNQQRKQQIETYLKEIKAPNNFRIIIGHSRDTMVASDAVLLASGTATLEAMLCKRPMVVAYRIKPVTEMIMKRLYKPKYFSLPNLLSGRELVPELLQEDVNPEKMASLLEGMIKSADRDMLDTFKDIHLTLKRDADKAAASAVLELIQK